MSIADFLHEKPEFSRRRITSSGARLYVTIWRWSTHVQVVVETEDLSGPDCRWLSKALSDAADFKRTHRPKRGLLCYDDALG